MPRVETEFIMSPVLLYEVMERLAFFSRGFTRVQMQQALALPCQPLDDLVHKYESNSKIFIHEGSELTDQFRSLWNLQSDDISYQERKFDEFYLHSPYPPPSMFLLFQGENLEAKTAIGTTMRWPIPDLAHITNDSETTPFNMTDMYIPAHILESIDPESCYRIITMPMNPPGFSFVLFRPKSFCSYEKLLHELGKLDLVTLLHHKHGPKAGKPIRISFAPFILSSSLNLNLPLQSLTVVDMYNREEAQFANIFKCEAATLQLTLKDVVHEAEIQLNEQSFPFRHLAPESDLGQHVETETICGKFLFFVMDDLKWVPLLFGEKISQGC
eukprot:TCALIF_05082-PA protein Name:"Protein of unknown function" AED:0.26 eAED:0.26 QI:8/1/0.66/1/0.5/0.66/3/0/327